MQKRNRKLESSQGQCWVGQSGVTGCEHNNLGLRSKGEREGAVEFVLILHMCNSQKDYANNNKKLLKNQIAM